MTNRHSTWTSTLTQGQAKGTGWLLLPSLLGEFQCLSDLGGNKAMSSEQPRQGKGSLPVCRATLAARVLCAPPYEFVCTKASIPASAPLLPLAPTPWCKAGGADLSLHSTKKEALKPDKNQRSHQPRRRLVSLTHCLASLLEAVCILEVSSKAEGTCRRRWLWVFWKPAPSCPARDNVYKEDLQTSRPSFQVRNHPPRQVLPVPSHARHQLKVWRGSLPASCCLCRGG